MDRINIMIYTSHGSVTMDDLQQASKMRLSDMRGFLLGRMKSHNYNVKNDLELYGDDEANAKALARFLDKLMIGTSDVLAWARNEVTVRPHRNITRYSPVDGGQTVTVNNMTEHVLADLLVMYDAMVLSDKYLSSGADRLLSLDSVLNNMLAMLFSGVMGYASMSVDNLLDLIDARILSSNNVHFKGISTVPLLMNVMTNQCKF